jgi:hypothetical protein
LKKQTSHSMNTTHHLYELARRGRWMAGGTGDDTLFTSRFT